MLYRNLIISLFFMAANTAIPDEKLNTGNQSSEIYIKSRNLYSKYAFTGAIEIEGEFQMYAVNTGDRYIFSLQIIPNEKSLERLPLLTAEGNRVISQHIHIKNWQEKGIGILNKEEKERLIEAHSGGWNQISRNVASFNGKAKITNIEYVLQCGVFALQADLIELSDKSTSSFVNYNSGGGTC